MPVTSAHQAMTKELHVAYFAGVIRAIVGFDTRG